MEIEPFGFFSVSGFNVEDILKKIIINFEKTGKTDNNIFTHQYLGPARVKAGNKSLLIDF